MIEDLLMGLGLVAVMAVIAIWWIGQMSPSEEWDMAANNMWVHGYTDEEIEQELGPRPEDPTEDD